MYVDSIRLGKYGSIWCKDTLQYNTPSGTFVYCFHFTEATVFTSLGFASAGATLGQRSPDSSGSNWNTKFASASSVLASMTFAAGDTIYGMWTSWKLASGGLIAYKDALPAIATG